jgi:hypothetical protein
MSVQSNTYVMVGVKLEYGHFSEEQEGELLEPYKDSAYKGIHHHNGLCVLSDGMGGRYIFAGRILAKTIDDDGRGFDMTDCTVSAEAIAGVSILLTTHLGIDKPKVKLWAFTHYR